jgi:peptidoglycan biosynthesis protein MviN/MurJ (putative lipid II flippase)
MTFMNALKYLAVFNDMKHYGSTVSAGISSIVGLILSFALTLYILRSEKTDNPGPKKLAAALFIGSIILGGLTYLQLRVYVSDIAKL